MFHNNTKADDSSADAICLPKFHADIASTPSSTQQIQARLTPQAEPVSDKKEDITATVTTGFSASFLIGYNELNFGDQIDEGNFGIVYRGTRNGETVAIKKLKVFTKKAIEGFRHESEMLAVTQKQSLTQVVRYVGCSMALSSLASPSYCIVTELATEGNAYQFVQHLRQFPEAISWRQRYGVMAEMVYACVEVHAIGMLHRDLKPHNYLRTADGKMKLADFGLAMMLGNQSYKILNSTKGSPAYIAPEICTHGRYSRESDVFALGSVLYTMAGEGTPFSRAGWTIKKMLSQVARGERAKISSSCPAGLAELINWCWKAEPDERPAAKKLYDELKKLQEQEAKEDVSVQAHAKSMPS